MNIKMIALDLDGTLLQPDKTLSQENQQILQYAALEHKIHIVPATGRAMEGIGQLKEWLPCIRYAVLSNGAIVADTLTGEMISCCQIEREEVLKFYDYIQPKNLVIDFFYKGMRMVPVNWEKAVSEMDISPGTKQVLLCSYEIVEDQRGFLEQCEGVEKISIRFRNEAEKGNLYEQLQKQFPQLQICSSLNSNIEVTRQGVTKATGLKTLAEHLNLSLENVMAFGDNGNDYSMIEAAGIGVAMGNAREEIKEIADWITKSNTENGVAYMIREVFGWKQELQ